MTDIVTASAADKSTGENTENAGESHALRRAWTFWHMRKTPGSRNFDSYEKNIKQVGTFGTVEEFWSVYSHMIRPNDLPNTTDYHLFADGIKPMWEDSANKKGGKWIIRLKKGLASRYWEDVVFAIVGCQFDLGDEICGAVMSIRYQEDLISVWNRTASNRTKCLKIKDTLKRVLSLPSNAIMEYKRHDESLKDNSSFRNTDVFK
eukprot:TRINITY_DN11300_c0_g1_i1.p1 TRINITY_DN11300_c0_g1~~TRINITY_DN11300_c0_g1_i1.p1  ORF type:complete len:205 (+),score=34.61 TRINITY_DN11300_c0_g1_i1:423-1037(+)